MYGERVSAKQGQLSPPAPSHPSLYERHDGTQVSKNPVYLNKLNSQSRGGASGGGVDMAEEIAMQVSVLNMPSKRSCLQCLLNVYSPVLTMARWL